MEITSSLIEGFLRNPVVVIRLADSAEVVQLRKELEAAKREASFRLVQLMGVKSISVYAMKIIFVVSA